MRRRLSLLACPALLGACAQTAERGAGTGVQRMYVFNCGDSTVKVVHLQENWKARRAPSFNYDREQSLAAMEKVARILSETGAELWIDHDKAQSDRMPKAPAFID